MTRTYKQTQEKEINQYFSPSELNMWDKSKKEKSHDKKMSDDEINTKYESGNSRILMEFNREKLPLFVDALTKPGYMDLRPFFQRRPRWKPEQQSLLIESFIINLPVPPVILYEKKYNSYEVIDGQQRISALRDFYEDKLILTGLQLWPELNGRKYSNLPTEIQAGIDRRTLSSIVVITESAKTLEDAMYLKRLTFERLNTGGVELSNQEIRNCLYHGQFNDSLIELADDPTFKNAWGIPDSDLREREQNNLYKKMEDVELVLRFFALRHYENFKGTLESFMDLYMIQSLDFSKEDTAFLSDIFKNTISIAYDIYGKHLFRPYILDKSKNWNWAEEPYKAYYDAVMVAFSKNLSNAQILKQKKNQVIDATQQLLKADKSELFRGKGKNTKTDIQKRLNSFEQMLSQVILSK
ncbi:DUF262 domain-containing protein [Microcoleus sp.]|uniref:DUF262 domain-containing protein n=1 Tax=Microcoleus sp. TaxID=44472 RepID=UPI0035264BCD